MLGFFVGKDCGKYLRNKRKIKEGNIYFGLYFRSIYVRLFSFIVCRFLGG